MCLIRWYDHWSAINLGLGTISERDGIILPEKKLTKDELVSARENCKIFRDLNHPHADELGQRFQLLIDRLDQQKLTGLIQKMMLFRNSIMYIYRIRGINLTHHFNSKSHTNFKLSIFVSMMTSIRCKSIISRHLYYQNLSKIWWNWLSKIGSWKKWILNSHSVGRIFHLWKSLWNSWYTLAKSFVISKITWRAIHRIIFMKTRMSTILWYLNHLGNLIFWVFNLFIKKSISFVTYQKKNF